MEAGALTHEPKGYYIMEVSKQELEQSLQEVSERAKTGRVCPNCGRTIKGKGMRFSLWCKQCTREYKSRNPIPDYQPTKIELIPPPTFPIIPKRATTRVQRGLVKKQYDSMFLLQEGKCAICGKTSSENGQKLAVDHNHETGAIRGLLCSGCNSGLGYFHDNIELLEKSIEYLQRFEKS